MRIFKNFSDCKTPFFKSLLFITVESIIPGLLIWFLIGYDFSYSFKNNLPNPKALYIFLVLFFYFIYSFVTTTIFYYSKFHKADNFTYSLTITICLIMLYIIGIFIVNESFWIFVKFIIIFATAILFLPISVFITMFFNNLVIKKNEEYDQMLLAYKNGEIIPTNKLIKAQRYSKFIINREQKKEELEKFKKSLEEKLEEKIKENELKKKEKEKNINLKLDKKEEKQRLKEIEKNSKFKK
ncbi:hypothetical protein SLITO_v1c03520 [Spiroplasma litorale]|uniref:Transmembrane protein n=1 Tax=Spiroplasma litorale TaxID=216942 RepID=A0A0K1W1E7_9MOLU|nr:hypothetical protein [Spiroplasma litorale]AKX34006.1 hypothetical protein SLITO_v1c03520 [Spiroplasma litorale]